MKNMKKITAMLLAVLLAATGCASTGSSASMNTSSEPAKKQTVILPTALSEEEFSYHGVHIRIPDIFELKPLENNPEFLQSECNIPNEVWQELDWDGVLYHPHISFDTGYHEEYYNDLSYAGRKYSPCGARINYAKAGSEGGEDTENSSSDMVTAEITEERVRLNGVDVLIQKGNRTSGKGKDRALCSYTTLYMILNSNIVIIRFDSYSEQFDELFAESIKSIRVDEEEIPELVKQTDPENLTAAGLNTKVWQFNDLYLHVPASYIAVEMDNGYINWLSKDGSAYIYPQEVDAKVVQFGQDQWEAVLSEMSGFQSIEECSAGICNGMYYSSASYLFFEKNGNPCHGKMIVILPDQDGEKAVMIAAACPVDDAENQAMIDSVLNIAHAADGWIGEGLLTPETITMEEFEAMPDRKQ